MAAASQEDWIIWETKVFPKQSISVRGQGGINALRASLETQRRQWNGTFSVDGRREVKGKLKETDDDFILTFYRRRVAKPVGLKELLNDKLRQQ